jgi:hypothetical protein
VASRPTPDLVRAEASGDGEGDRAWRATPDQLRAQASDRLPLLKFYFPADPICLLLLPVNENSDRIDTAAWNRSRALLLPFFF